MAVRRVRIGIVGCGDVAHRRYLPALAAMPDRAEVGGCCDPNAAAAERAADSVRSWSPEVEAHPDVAQMLEGGRVDAIIGDHAAENRTRDWSGRAASCSGSSTTTRPTRPRSCASSARPSTAAARPGDGPA